MYFDSNKDYFYFGIVTSGSYRNHWAGEDTGIDLTGDGLFEFGVNIANTSAGSNINTGVWSVDEWKTYNSVETYAAKGTKLDTYAGAYELYSQKYSIYDPNHYVDESGTSIDYTYVLEGRIDRLLFENALGYSIACGGDIGMQLARVIESSGHGHSGYGCSNDGTVKDVIGLNGKFYGNCPPAVPEPTTMLLFGIGLFGIAGRSRFRRKKRIR